MYNLKELDILLECIEATLEAKKGLAAFYASKGKNRTAEAISHQLADLQLLRIKTRGEIIAKTFSETLPSA